MDIQVSTRYDGQQLHWKFGRCFSNVRYTDYMMYIHRCCLKPGQYTLTCINTEQPHGWKNGYIQIGGYRYCDDFMSYKAMRRITIAGIKLYNLKNS